MYNSTSVKIRFFLYTLLILAAAIQGAIYFRKLKPEFKLLTILLTATLLSEVAGRILAVFKGSSFPAYHFLIPIQFLLYPSIYLLFLSKGLRFTGIIALSSAALALLSIINSIFIQPLYTFPS